ncbi:AraC family transcriptional regulator [Novosphingobium sp.]|uniref:AraC family transcriptional regulator n=1 Tax=Novosphingobium sp. TaxID=1874826 RepID=UPI00286DE6E2|nr:AraC family transcriptional regulator [Novosphingobium sp.]
MIAAREIAEFQPSAAPPERSRSDGWSLSDFLNLLDLRGQTWCIVELRGSAGFNLPGDDGVAFYGVIKGSVRIAGVAGGTIEVGQGQVQIVLSGEAHAIRSEADSPTVVLDFLRHEQAVDTPPTFTIGTGPLAAKVLCARLKVTWPAGLRRTAMPASVRIEEQVLGNELNVVRTETLQRFSVGAGSTALLTRLAALWLAITLRNHPQCPLLFRMSASADPIAHALQLIDADIASEWSVERMARKVGMSRSSFAARFTSEVGQTPMELLTEKRMHAAGELLQNSRIKIAEISGRVGYQSEAAFSRRFARFFGMSPGQMRHGTSASHGVNEE